MEYSEKYGLDVDEAVRLALEELCLTEDQVMVTVLEESTKGFLGLGQKLAKVRVEKIAELDDEYTKEDLKQAEAILRDEKKAQSEAKAGHDFRKKPRPQQNNSRTGRTGRNERTEATGATEATMGTAGTEASEATRAEATEAGATGGSPAARAGRAGSIKRLKSISPRFRKSRKQSRIL